MGLEQEYPILETIALRGTIGGGGQYINSCLEIDRTLSVISVLSVELRIILLR